MEKHGQHNDNINSGSKVNTKWQKKLEILEQKARFYQQHHLVPEYKPRLREPSPYWKAFHRQKAAMETAILDNEDVHVFAYEPSPADLSASPSTGRRKYGITSYPEPASPSSGRRKYVVTSYPELWHQIQNRFQHQQSAAFYEIIPEGAACKLYFDLEYQKEYNPQHDGIRMVTSLIEVICQKLQDTFSVSCSNEEVIVFDASTDTKFSSHLIFNLHGTVFKDNIHAGHFVHDLCDDIRQKEQNDSNEIPPDAKKPRLSTTPTSFFVQNSDDKISLFIDEGVYTKNRNFRLYKCVKLGKKNPLVIADYSNYKLKQPRGNMVNKDKQLFMDSLITNIKCNSNTRILTVESVVRERISPTSCPPGSPNSSKTEGYTSDQSPFPDLDDFIKTVVTKGRVQGDIRRWVYFTESGTMVYDIIGNRWCENIGRAHKSNNIMFLVNLKKRIFYQKCHDPDCKRADYKSAERPLPAECLPTLGDYEDEELLCALEMVEEGDKLDMHNSEGSKSDMNSSTVSTETDSSIASPDAVDTPWGQGHEDITDEEFSEVYNQLLANKTVT